MTKKLNYPYNLLKEVRTDIEPIPENYPDTIDVDIEVAINALNNTEQSLMLHLRYKDGLTYKAIANIAGCGVEHVRTVLDKATRRLAHPARSRLFRFGVVEILNDLDEQVKSRVSEIDQLNDQISTLKTDNEELRATIDRLEQKKERGF